MLEITKKKKKSVIDVGWKCPPVGWVKINMDGANKDSCVARCGGLIRCLKGVLLGGFSKYSGKCNAFVAESWGVLKRLQYEKRLGFNFMELHVDSLVVANILIMGQETYPTSWSLVQTLRRLLQME